jgi:two-component system, OmpR family, alkaline phosphatase synthesis response regulator PhoP
MGKKILIVDDEPQIIQLLNSRLRANHYDVLAAYDPIQGFKQAIEQQPDLIILDIRMPAGGGGGLFKNLQQHVRTSLIPVIFITAYPSEDVRDAAFASGATDFISKPIDPDELLRKVKSALGES